MTYEWKKLIISFYIRRRVLEAVRILKGSLPWWVRKCRFSETRISAPVHSAYAAMNASAGFSPSLSYLNTMSKGTTISSSMIVKMFRKLKKSWKSLGIKLFLTSLAIVRHMESLWREGLSARRFKRETQAGSLARPKVKIYSLASRTRCKFFLPYLFSCFAKLFDDLFFGHPGEGRRPACHAIPNFLQKPVRLFRSLFVGHFIHRFSPPLINNTTPPAGCQSSVGARSPKPKQAPGACLGQKGTGAFILSVGARRAVPVQEMGQA